LLFPDTPSQPSDPIDRLLWQQTETPVAVRLVIHPQSGRDRILLFGRELLNLGDRLSKQFSHSSVVANSAMSYNLLSNSHFEMKKENCFLFLIENKEKKVFEA
jgi:hypothetical protein